ncbi:two-component regulator propeller domain-containing protein [Bacteroides sp. GD17]|jgi:signal transduction histidine kinase/ligand-binding sensor domain-containing protein/DNA-binding response OmpR family regulator|uniref:two-component regulator propeller domain-containing protein n=2 Tax=Bacteroides TaxID=816 RepID=UPI00313D8D82
MKTHIIFIIVLSAITIISCKPITVKEETNNPDVSKISATISNQNITAFQEDAQGYIWIGTARGLNKFNAHEYRQYYSSSDTLQLPGDRIQDIFMDSRKRLWIATTNGVCQYTDQDNFRQIPINVPYSNKNGYQLIENKNGKIFLNMIVHLCVYNPETESFNPIFFNFDPDNTYKQTCYIDRNNHLWAVNPTSIRCYDSSNMKLRDSIPMHQRITYSYMHNRTSLWLVSNNRLFIFDTENKRFKALPDAIKRHPILSKNAINYIHPYEKNSLLICTQNNMFLYNEKKDIIINEKEKEFPFEVPQYGVNCMFTDSHKNLWIGSQDQGYTVRYHYKERFNSNNYLRSFFSQKSIIAIDADQHNLYISTLKDGMYIYNLNTQHIKAVDINKIIPAENSGNIVIKHIYHDKDQHIWVATNTNQIIKCTFENNQLTATKTFSIPHPLCIVQDRNGTIWVGSFSQTIYALREGEKDFTPISLYPKSYFTFTPAIRPLSNGEILIASFANRIRLVNPDTWKSQMINISRADSATCIRRSKFIPTTLYEDSQGDIWIGTSYNGLLRYSPQNQKLVAIPGIACTEVCSIEEDVQGNIWISTLYGLSKYERRTNQVSNYYASDGIEGNQFYDRASCRLSDGTLIFGGTHGITFFNPMEAFYKYNIPLKFESLKIHNQLIQPGENAIIEKDLSCQPDIHLRHDQTSFSISFAALDYSEYERIHYHYQLEGIDRYWIHAYTNREAYYANLPAGTYIFKIKITNEDQSIIGKEKRLRIIIKPAPWDTWWARCLYTLAIIGIAGILIHSWRRIKIEKETAYRAEQEKAQEQKMNKIHMSYFTNISHEFRTPLTTMLGSIRQLCAVPANAAPNKELLNILQDGILRMLRLVNQLLDFNKIDNNSLGLEVQQTNLTSTIKQIISFFSINAQSKNITIIPQGLHNDILSWADEDKVEKILSNLLSNAMKFTPAGGEIEVSFATVMRQEIEQSFKLTEQDKSTRYVQISIANTGENIPEDQLEKIFERFYQIKENKGTYNWGTGIGLYYARSLAKLHHGYLEAANRKEGGGAVFTLVLPADDFSYTKEERCYGPKTPINNIPIKPAEIQPDDSHKDQINPKTVLIVDDDPTIMHYLQILLTPYYHIISRFNSNNILQTIAEEAPDLVLSDVLMPDKDGYQLCKEIKANLQFCHIPVILVTAKATMENQIEGLHTGADAYVPKPFEPAYLLALIESLLTNRDKVRNFLVQNTRTSQTNEFVLTPKDEAFMAELYKLMENELDNPELDITRMTELLKISRTKFYYKVKGLTGKNPSVFFRTYKLNRAAELIKEGIYTISEIADMTGFNTLSHFSTCFKKQFGVNPSEYQ